MSRRVATRCRKTSNWRRPKPHWTPKLPETFSVSPLRGGRNVRLNPFRIATPIPTRMTTPTSKWSIARNEHVSEELEERRRLRDHGRWVVKIGSSLLTAEGQGIDRAGIQRWAGQIARLVAEGCEVVLVTSGAVAEGCSRLGFRERPTAIHELQAAAAVGQMGLI